MADAQNALAALQQALDALEAIREEYAEWRDALPENLQGSTLGEKLDAVADLDFACCADDVEAVLDDAEGADLPLGFGRD